MLHHGKFVIRAGRKSGSIAMDRLDFSERGSTPAYPFKKTRHRCRNGARPLVVRSEPHEMTNARGERCDATGRTQARPWSTDAQEARSSTLY